MKTDNQYQGIGPLFDTIKCGIESTCVAVDEHGREIPPDDICENYHKGNKNSVQANKIAHKGSVNARKRILQLLQDKEWHDCPGMMCEELEQWLQLSHQTCSARLSELRREGKIKIVETRKTRSGSPAAVYQAI